MKIYQEWKRLEHVPPSPSSQGHLDVVSIRSEEQLEKWKNKETKKCNNKENVKTKPTRLK